MQRDDLEPFLSDIENESLPLALRLGSLVYFQERESFLDEDVRLFLDQVRERLMLLILENEEATEIPATQGILF